MSIVVSLEDVVNEIDVPNQEWTAYLNRKTGEFLTVTEEDVYAVEEPEDLDNLPDWQREHLPKVREALQSDDFLPLPSKFEIHEWEIMDRFCGSIDEAELRAQLLHAIRGSGAFRRFKDLIHHHGIQDSWYSFRQRSLEQIAADWLDANGIPYARG